MLPLTQQEKAVLTAVIAVVLIGSAGKWVVKAYPRQVDKLDFIEHWDVEAKLDLNRAGRQELIGLPNIGPARAEAILNFRRENGPFENVGQLRRVRGIGPKIFEKIKPHVKVRGP